jgi:hypothetical protein
LLLFYFYKAKGVLKKKVYSKEKEFSKIKEKEA